jgi:hypothetical protein
MHKWWVSVSELKALRERRTRSSTVPATRLWSLAKVSAFHSPPRPDGPDTKPGFSPDTHAPVVGRLKVRLREIASPDGSLYAAARHSAACRAQRRGVATQGGALRPAWRAACMAFQHGFASGGSLVHTVHGGSLPLWSSESRVAELVRAWCQGNQAGAHPEKHCDAEDALVAQLWGPMTTRLPRLEASSP